MKRISLLMLAASLAAGAQASEPPSAETAEPANTVIAASNEAAASVYESAQKVKFSWGADIGAAIDLSANDMSAVDVSAMFGLKWRWLKFAGVGAQAKLMTMNSCRSFPVFLKLRTNFRDGDSLLFWDVSAGVSLNYLEDDRRQNGLYASTGLGIRLAYSNRYSSHMTIGYAFHDRHDLFDSESGHTESLPDLHYAFVKIGLCF